MPARREPPSREAEGRVDCEIQDLIDKADVLVYQLRNLVNEMKSKSQPAEEDDDRP